MSEPLEKFSVAHGLFDNNVQSYSEIIEECFGGLANHDFFVQNKADILRERLATLSLGDKKARVLDVGCGSGLVHMHLQNDNIELHGVDISKASLEQASTRNPGVTYQHFEGEHIPYKEEMFDLTFAIGVMHHLPPSHWETFVQELKRVTRPGGMIVIIEHNPLNPGTQWVVLRCPLDEGAVMLWHWKLKRFLSEAGLQHIKVRNVLFLPFKGKFYARLNHWLRFLPFGTQYWASAIVPDQNA